MENPIGTLARMAEATAEATSTACEAMFRKVPAADTNRRLEYVIGETVATLIHVCDRRGLDVDRIRAACEARLKEIELGY